MKEVKRCHNLIRDKNGNMFCKTTHICYRRYCLRDLYTEVEHVHGEIIVRNNG